MTSDDSFEEVKSLSDKSSNRKSSPIRESKVESGQETSAPNFNVISEIDVMETPGKELSYSSKKKPKNSKLSSKKALFEQEWAMSPED